MMYVFIAVALNSVIAVLDADFHSLPSTQHRQQYGPVGFFYVIPTSSLSFAYEEIIILVYQEYDCSIEEMLL